MRELFPNAQLLYRTTTRLNGIRAKDDNEMVTIFQQNESAKALMKALGIPVLNCEPNFRLRTSCESVGNEGN